MWAWRAVSRALALAAGLALQAAAPGAAADPAGGAPQRVVSINLCTDQLAMLLAAPGQLLSVTWLAQDARSSAMAEAAMAWPVNRGGAEDIFLMAPDLVLAGSFTTAATVEMLRRLGIRVEVFPPAQGLADVPGQLRRMGALLGRAEEGAAEAAAFEAALAELAQAGAGPLAALYYAGGYTSGRQSLPGEILAAAGFENAADALGLEWGGFLPLEALILADPALVVTGLPYPGASRAEELLAHPALAAARAGRAGLALSDRDWVCGLPHVLNAVAAMAGLRARVEAGP